MNCRAQNDALIQEAKLRQRTLLAAGINVLNTVRQNVNNPQLVQQFEHQSLLLTMGSLATFLLFALDFVAAYSAAPIDQQRHILLKSYSL